MNIIFSLVNLVSNDHDDHNIYELRNWEGNLLKILTILNLNVTMLMIIMVFNDQYNFCKGTFCVFSPKHIDRGFSPSAVLM